MSLFCLQAPASVSDDVVMLNATPCPYPRKLYPDQHLKTEEPC